MKTKPKTAAKSRTPAQNNDTPHKAKTVSGAIGSPEAELQKQCDKFGLRPVIHDTQCREYQYDWKALAIDGRSQPWEMRGYCDPDRVTQSEAVRLYAAIMSEYEYDTEAAPLLEWLRGLERLAERIETGAAPLNGAHQDKNPSSPLLGVDECQLERVAGHMDVSSEEFVAECVRVTLAECDPEHKNYRAEIYAAVRQQVLDHRIGLRGEKPMAVLLESASGKGGAQ